MQQDSCNKPSTGCLKDCESRHSFHKEASEARELNAAPLPRAPFPGFSLGLLNCFPKPSERSPIAFLPFLFLQAHSWIGKHWGQMTSERFKTKGRRRCRRASRRLLSPALRRRIALSSHWVVAALNENKRSKRK